MYFSRFRILQELGITNLLCVCVHLKNICEEVVENGSTDPGVPPSSWADSASHLPSLTSWADSSSHLPSRNSYLLSTRLWATLFRDWTFQHWVWDSSSANTTSASLRFQMSRQRLTKWILSLCHCKFTHPDRRRLSQLKSQAHILAAKGTGNLCVWRFCPPGVEGLSLH